MKKIKIEIEVQACEICGKKLETGVIPIEALKPAVPALDRGVEVGTAEEAVRYAFHPKCAEEVLIKRADELAV